MNDTVQPEWLKNHVPAPNPGNPNWKKGVSGNPRGRPPGQTPQAKLTKRMLEEGEQVLDAVLTKAKEGDASSAALVFSRILPALRSQSQTVQFDFDPSLPISQQVEQVLVAVAAGQVAPDVGQQIITAIAALSSIRDSEELERRLALLQAKEVNP